MACGAERRGSGSDVLAVIVLMLPVLVVLMQRIDHGMHVVGIPPQPIVTGTRVVVRYRSPPLRMSETNFAGSNAVVVVAEVDPVMVWHKLLPSRPRKVTYLSVSHTE